MRAMFKDRVDAGRKLARELLEYKETGVVVLAIPRGGVPVAVEVARALGAPFDLVVPRKIGAPGNPELAIGAVTEDGTTILNEDLVASLNVSDEYIREEAELQQREVERRIKEYRGDRPLPDLRDRRVIIVDDGVATGATTAAAVESVRNRGASEVVLAVPVGPPDAIEDLRGRADQVVVLYEPRRFYAVGAYYEDFTQTTDREVKELLEEMEQG